MPEHFVRDCPLVCPDCHGREFSKKAEVIESKMLFLTKKEGIHRYDCSGCGYSYIIK